MLRLDGRTATMSVAMNCSIRTPASKPSTARSTSSRRTVNVRFRDCSPETAQLVPAARSCCPRRKCVSLLNVANLGRQATPTGELFWLR